MLNAMNRPGAVLAYAVLLHDVGKPATAVPSIQPDGSRRVRFDGHDHVGAVLAEGVLRRLRMPARETEDIVHCVRNHMRFMMAQRMKRSTLRRLVSSPTFSDELELHRLDCEASHRDLANYEFLQRFVAELRNEPALPEPWINGRDLMAMGLPEGPDVGRWLRVAYDAQLEGRFQGPDELRTWIRRSLAESNGKRGNTA
jgi:poly(A) polymerase